MSVIFDDRWIGRHGIGRFASELMARLPFVALSLGGRPSSPLDPLKLSWALRKFGKGDTFFSPGYNAPLFFRGKFIICIHDLNHIDRPENSSFFKRVYYEFFLKNACKRAEHIITVSEFSKARITQWSGISSSKVTVVGNGVSQEFLGASRRSESGASNYFICVGNRKSHKNESRVVEALARFPKESNIFLKFTGISSAGLQNLIEQLGVQDRVSFLGSVGDQALVEAYANAIALVFPSLYEGFGLPIVEAFATRTPVITSNVSSLPEVAGEAAVLVDPQSVDSIFDAMVLVSEDAELRARLIASGIERSSLFTWERVVERVKKVIARQE